MTISSAASLSLPLISASPVAADNLWPESGLYSCSISRSISGEGAVPYSLSPYYVKQIEPLTEFTQRLVWIAVASSLVVWLDTANYEAYDVRQFPINIVQWKAQKSIVFVSVPKLVGRQVNLYKERRELRLKHCSF